MPLYQDRARVHRTSSLRLLRTAAVLFQPDGQRMLPATPRATPRHGGLGPSEERFATYIAPRRLRGCRRADRCRCRRQRTGSRHWRRLLSSTAYGRLIQINYLRRRRVECSIRQGRTSLIREKCNDPVDSCGGGLGVGIISSGRSPCASSSAG